MAQPVDHATEHAEQNRFEHAHSGHEPTISAT
jgi:hypothetical protein